MLPTVELHPAFMWDCDNCGVENIARTVGSGAEAVPVDDPDLTVTLEHFAAPEVVTCKECNRSFKAIGEVYDFGD